MIFFAVVLTRSTPGDHWREKSNNGKSMDGAGAGAGGGERSGVLLLCIHVYPPKHLSHTGVDTFSGGLLNQVAEEFLYTIVTDVVRWSKCTS